MKKIIYAIAAVMLASGSFIAANAQQSNLRTAYFLDGYTYRYKLNPSLAPERGFFAIPVLGNVGVGAESNLGVSNFYMPNQNGKLAFFLDNSVSDDQFLGGLKERNILNTNVNLNLFALGFRTGKSYHTLDVSLNANARSNLPKSLFSFAKVGTAGGNTSWLVNDLGVRSDNYAEIAYGYSRPIGENLRVGGRFKFLLGVLRSDVMIDQIELTMNRERWAAKADGHADISGAVSVGTVSGSNLIDYDSFQIPEDFNDLMSKKSFGVALDLGASYDFLEYFTASLSLLDVGFISWNNTTTAVAPGKSWTFDGFGTIKTDGTTDFGEQFSQFGDDMLDMIQLEKTGDNQKMSKGLSATLHAGIEARMPFYQRLAFGLLATHRFDNDIQEAGLSNRVKCTVFIDRMELAYAAADVVISRAGAISISELSLLSKAVVFVPLPTAAEDHQTKNAQRLVDDNAAILVKNSETEKELLPVVFELLNNDEKQSEMKRNIAKFAKPNAAEDIVDQIENVLKSIKNQ